MSDFIKDIPSDSTVVKIELQDYSATVTVKLDIYDGNKDTKTINFTSVKASSILPGWQSDIEGIEIKTESELLQQTKLLLKKNEVLEENIQSLKSYHFLSSNSGNPVIEIIARSYKVE